MSEIREQINGVYRQYYDELYRFLSFKLRCREDAAEIAQEAFTRMLALEDGFQFRHLRGFLFRTALNLTADSFRAGRLRTEQIDEAAVAETLPSEAPGSESVIHSRQRLALLRGAIDELPPKCRHAFLRHKFENRSYAEIASEMGISKNMVEKHIIKAIAYCRGRMERAD